MRISFLTGVSVSIRVLPALCETCLFLGAARVNGLMSLGVTTLDGPLETVSATEVLALGTSADSDELYCGTSDGSTVKLAAGTHASVTGAGADAEDSECSVAVGSALLGTSADSDELYCGTSDGSTIKLAAGTHASVMGAGADAGDPGCSVAVGSALSAAEENPLLVIRL